MFFPTVDLKDMILLIINGYISMTRYLFMNCCQEKCPTLQAKK